MSLSIRRIALGDVTPDLAHEWVQLLRASNTDLSLAPEWFASSVRSRHMMSSAGIFTVHRSGKLMGVLPHVLRHERIGGLPVSTVEAPGSYLVAYHPEIVSADAAAVLDALINECARRYDVFVLPNLPVGSVSAEAVHEVARTNGVLAMSRDGHTSPYLAITSGWDEFIATKDKKFRYKVRNSLKELEAAGQVHERWFIGSADLEQFFQQMLHIEAHSWKVQAGMAISSSDLERGFYENLLPYLAREDALRANVLYLNGQPVAYSLCYQWHGVFRQLKTSFDDRCAKLSAGSAVMHSSIKRAFESGAHEFDFLGDAMPHKNQWASGVRRHTTVHVFLRTWRGRLAGRLRQIADQLRSRQADNCATAR